MVIKNNENDFCQQKRTVLQIKSAVNYNKRKKKNTGNCRVSEIAAFRANATTKKPKPGTLQTCNVNFIASSNENLTLKN